MVGSRAGLSRGVYENPGLQRTYEKSKRPISEAGVASEYQLLHAYYLYLCRRKLRMAFLAGAYDDDGIVAYVRYAAGLLFDLLGRGAGRSFEFSDRPVRLSLRRAYMHSEPTEAMQLGQSGKCLLGEQTALGTSTVGIARELAIDVAVRLADWNDFACHDTAAVSFMEACDLCVPLTMNFKLRFHADRRDCSFTLSDRTDPSVAAAALPVVLGINSELGA